MFLLFGIVILLIFVVLVSIGFIYRKGSAVCKCKNILKGRTVIITGATAGIGKETAKDLASREARLILACRNLEKAEKVKEWIVSLTANQNIIIRHLDVSDLDSVRMFAAEILKTEDKLDILINNAGLYIPSRRESKQCLELTIATNYFGHFLLTNLLLGLLKKGAPSRIINVSSRVHKNASLDLDDPHFRKKKYSHFQAYAQSKLCNILFTRELAHLLQGTNVTVNAIHPGIVDTEIANKEPTVLGCIIKMIGKRSFMTAELGAQTTIHVAVSNEGGKVTGEYFSDCKITKTSKLGADAGLAKKLWEYSEKEVQLQNNERSS